MPSSDDRIVDVVSPDPRPLRPTRPIAALGEFLEFLDEIEELLGVGDRRVPSRPVSPLRL